MATNLGLDDHLIDIAFKLGKQNTKTAAVNAALEEYVKQQRRMRILDLEGTVDFRPEWDYKADRLRGLRRIPKE